MQQSWLQSSHVKQGNIDCPIKPEGIQLTVMDTHKNQVQNGNDYEKLMTVKLDLSQCEEGPVD